MWILKIAITFAAFSALLYLLDKFLEDFKIEPKGIVTVALILLPVNYILGFILKILKFPFEVITLGLLSFVFNWLISVAIMWVTDYFTDQLTIKKTPALLISGAALSLTVWVVKIIF
jgi:uncharacterized membrane protein YvlD (DUF360 family)